MRIHILGTAQDAGVPQLFCECANCHAARDSGLQRTASCVLVEWQGKRWLLDASPDLRHQWPGGALDGIVLTHAHAGHVAGLALLGKEGPNLRTPLVVTPSMLTYLAGNEPFASIIKNMQVHVVSPGYSWGPFTFHPIQHRAEYSDTVAIAFKGSRTLMYLPDTDAYDAAVQAAAATLNAGDVLLFDGTFFGNDVGHRDQAEIPHPPIQDSLPQLQELVARGVQVWLTHFNHTNPVLNDSPERQCVIDAGVGILTDGLVLDLGP